MPQTILLSFVGSRDPFNQQTKKLGPILTLLNERSFDVLHLFFNLGADWNARASQTLSVCRKSGRVGEVGYQPLDIMNVTDHAELFRVINHACQNLKRAHPEAQFSIATASGTPAMQTVWVLLAQSGLFPATLLVTTPPEFARAGSPLVREVDLELDGFPQIQSPDEAKRQLSIFHHQIETLKTENAALLVQNTTAQKIEVSDDGFDLKEALRNQEIAYFRLALEKSAGNAAHAARLLNLKSHAFRKRAVTLGISDRNSQKSN